MTQLKKKIVEETKKKTGTSLYNQTEANTSSEELMKIREVWQSEVKHLSTQTFATVEIAAEAVISAVTERLKIPANERDRVVGFLNTLIDSDPQIKAILQKRLVANK